MSNSTYTKAISDITKSLNGFNYPELAIYVYSYLGVFDDIRPQIIALIDGPSGDWLYSPKFLHESVIVPCYSIGKILAKKRPLVLPKPVGASASSFNRERKKAETKYSAIGFLLSFEMVVDYFKIMKSMTQAEINKINLHSIFPGGSFRNNNDKIFLGAHTRFSGVNLAAAKVVARSAMHFSFSEEDKLSPVLKVLPHAYLRTKYEVPEDAPPSKEYFARPSVSLSDMFDQSFWGPAYKFHPHFPSTGPKWVDVPKALLPSFWWNSIIDSSDLVRQNMSDLCYDCLLVSANYSYFDVCQTNMLDLLSRLHQVAVREAEKEKRAESPTVEIQDMPSVEAYHQELENPGLIAEPHQHPATMHLSNQPRDHIGQHSLVPRGEIIQYPASNVPVQQSVLPQALFGHLLHVSTSFDLATYLNVATHDVGLVDEDQDAGLYAPSPSDFDNLVEFGGSDVVPMARNIEAPAAASCCARTTCCWSPEKGTCWTSGCCCFNKCGCCVYFCYCCSWCVS